MTFTYHNGNGINPDTLYLSNGDEIQLTNLGYDRTGDNRKELPITEQYVIAHYTEDFRFTGVAGKVYTVTREVILRDRKDPKHYPFTAKIIAVKG